MYKALGIERDDMAGRLEQGRKNYEFFGAPVGIFITVNKALGSNGWGYVGHMVQTLCLAAVNEGLGTCLQEAWSGFPQLVRKMLIMEMMRFFGVELHLAIQMKSIQQTASELIVKILTTMPK